MKDKYNFTRSDIKMLILSLLFSKDMYGYMLIQELKDMSNNYFCLKEGCLYPILHSLEQEKLIVSYWEDSKSKRKKKYYSITDIGKKYLEKEKMEWKKYSSYINDIIGGVVNEC